MSEAQGLWLQALDQEKTPYETLDPSLKDLDARRHPVAVIARRPSSENLKKWLDFLKNGGAVVSAVQTAHLLQQGEREGKIFAVEDPDPIEKSMGRAAEKRFFFDESCFVTETVAAAPAGSWRRGFTACLKKAFWSQGLPFVRLGYYPAEYDGLFAFRMDLDHHVERDFNEVCGLLRRYEGVITCFVNVRSYEREIPALGRLKSLRAVIGSHAYVHHVYDQYGQNRWNIERAEELLRPFARPLEGFSAPHGRWHASLQRVLEEKGYLYSSEFTLDYDDLPFFPRVNGKLSSVLQIPTHPVCDGVFLERYGFKPKLIEDYYSKVIAQKSAEGEPVLIFGHPDGRIGRHPEIFHSLMAAVARHPSWWKTDFGSWARWWTRRNGWTLEADWQDGLRVTRFPEDRQASLDIFLPGGAKLNLPAAEALKPLSMEEMTKMAASAQATPQVLHETPENLSLWKRFKRWIKNWLDWETKTPINFYLLASPRDFLRYAIRMAYDVSAGLTGKKPDAHNA